MLAWGNLGFLHVVVSRGLLTLWSGAGRKFSSLRARIPAYECQRHECEWRETPTLPGRSCLSSDDTVRRPGFSLFVGAGERRQRTPNTQFALAPVPTPNGLATPRRIGAPTRHALFFTHKFRYASRRVAKLNRVSGGQKRVDRWQETRSRHITPMLGSVSIRRFGTDQICAKMMPSWPKNITFHGGTLPVEIGFDPEPEAAHAFG